MSSGEIVEIQHREYCLVPITSYFGSIEQARDAEPLRDGYEDLVEPLPSWEILLKRSRGQDPEHPRYMTYLLVVDRSTIAGLLAIQQPSREEVSVRLIHEPPFPGECLYLSWIALAREFQSRRLYKMLFAFYESLLKTLAKNCGHSVFGGMIALRRLRAIHHLMSGDPDPLNNTVTEPFRFAGRQIEFWVFPGEFIHDDTSRTVDYCYIRLLSLEE